MNTKNRRRLDLIILDDEEILLELISTIALENYGLESKCFNSGLELSSYLKSIPVNSKLPLGYLLDMNIKKGKVEQRTPELIFEQLKNRSVNLDNFSYMTGHYSSHDEGVIRKTHTNIISPKYPQNLEGYFTNLAKTKLLNIPKSRYGTRLHDKILYSIFPDFNLLTKELV